MRIHEIIGTAGKAAASRVRKKSTISPPTTPAFKQWFGTSKVVDKRGRPLICYHGTFNTFDRFDPKRGSTGMTFFSTNPKMANGYANSIRDAEGNLGAGAKLIPVYLRILDPYDYRTADNARIAYRFYREYGYPEGDDARQIRIALYGRADLEDDHNPEITDEPLEADDFIEALNHGHYPALEMLDFLDFLQGQGHDGIVTHEVRSINFGVFDASQAKSIFAKEFNPDSDHLNEATGPEWFTRGKRVDSEAAGIDDYLEGDEFDWDWRLCKVPLAVIETDPAPDVLDQDRLNYQRTVKQAGPVVLGIRPDRIQVYDGWHRITIARERGDRTMAAYVGMTAGQGMLGEESALSRHRDYTWIRQDAKRWDATFQVGDHGYWFTAYESKGRIPPSYDLENVWVVQFGIDKEDAIKLHGHKHAIMNMTGLRKPFGVISTILAVFEDFINSKQPEIVWFSDSFGSSGRRKMYQMASDLLSKKYGYQEDQAVMRYFAKEIDGGSMWMLRRSES